MHISRDYYYPNGVLLPLVDNELDERLRVLSFCFERLPEIINEISLGRLLEITLLVDLVVDTLFVAVYLAGLFVSYLLVDVDVLLSLVYLSLF